MKIKNLFSLRSAAFALLLVSALMPILSAQPFPYTGPVLSDIVWQTKRFNPDGSVIYPTPTLLQIENLFEPTAGSGISIGALPNGTFTISSALQNSGAVAIGYSTGLGVGQTITQSSSKSTAVIMPAACYTGTIVMNNASLANAATVKFTVTDTAVAASDIVVANPQQGSITSSAAYLVTCNSNNGSFVVNVYNAGTTNSDAIILNFIVLRASGN